VQGQPLLIVFVDKEDGMTSRIDEQWICQGKKQLTKQGESQQSHVRLCTPVDNS